MTEKERRRNIMLATYHDRVAYAHEVLALYWRALAARRALGDPAVPDEFRARDEAAKLAFAGWRS